MKLAASARVQLGRRAHRFVRLRQHATSKLCALAFITLILLPFTAPFATYPLDDSSGGYPYDTPKDLKDKIVSDHKLAAPSAWSMVSPAMAIVIVSYFVRSNQAEEHPPQHTVLRL